MKTSFEFIHQGHKGRAEYEMTRKLNMGAFKMFSFRVLKDSTWIYQGTLSFPAKKQIIEQVAHIFGPQETSDE